MGAQRKSGTDDQFLPAIKLIQHSAEPTSQQMPSFFTDRARPLTFSNIDIQLLQTTDHLLAILLLGYHQPIGITTQDLSGIGAESEPAIVVELLDCTHQPDDAVTEQVVEGIVLVNELFHDRNHQSNVRLHDAVAMPVSQCNQLFQAIDLFGRQIFAVERDSQHVCLVEQKIHSLKKKT